MKRCLILILILGYSSEQIIPDEYEDDLVESQKNFNRPIYDYEDDYVGQNQKKYKKPTHTAPLRQQAPLPAIVKQINDMNEDGSYTFGYQSEDGSYRVETRNTDGYTRGKYGYIDAGGELKEVEYTAGSTGYVPSGEHIQVPPPAPPPRPEVAKPEVSQGKPRLSPQKKVIQDYNIDYEDDLVNIQSEVSGNSNKNYDVDNRRNNEKKFSQREIDSNNAANAGSILELSIEYPNAGRVPTVDRIFNEGRNQNERRRPNVRNSDGRRDSYLRTPNGRRDSNLRTPNGKRHPNVRISDGRIDLNERRNQNAERRLKNQFVGTSKNGFNF
uniref:Cuticle protein 6 n=1 Tax=Strigamia maritima TaxID=126957 RepID=T1JK31_STRMM